jgi:hypothetical protein
MSFRVSILNLVFFFFPLGQFWEDWKWTEGNQHKPGSSEEKFPGTNWIKIYTSQNSAVFWWGQTIVSSSVWAADTTPTHMGHSFIPIIILIC